MPSLSTITPAEIRCSNDAPPGVRYQVILAVLLNFRNWPANAVSLGQHHALPTNAVRASFRSSTSTAPPTQ